MIQAALDLVRSKGLAALSARQLGQALGCSVRPIYGTFPSMDALRSALLERIVQVFMEHLLRDDSPAGPGSFLAMGLGYLRFARQEPELYRALFLSRHEVFERSEDAIQPVFESMALHPQMADLSRDQLERILRDLWFYTHGLATLSAVGQVQAREDELAARLERVALLFIGAERGD